MWVDGVAEVFVVDAADAAVEGVVEWCDPAGCGVGAGLFDVAGAGDHGGDLWVLPQPGDRRLSRCGAGGCLRGNEGGEFPGGAETPVA